MNEEKIKIQNESSLLNIKQLAERLNCKESWIRQMVFRKKIPFCKLMGILRFDIKQIEKWLEENSHKPRGQHG